MLAALFIGRDVDRKVIILDACVVIHAFDSDAEQHVEARDLVKILKEKISGSSCPCMVSLKYSAQ